MAKHGTAKQIVGAQRVLSEFWIEFYDHVSDLLAQTHAMEDEELLRGIQPAEHELRRLCDMRGIRPGAPLAIAVARPRQANGHHVDGEVTLRSLARLVEQMLPLSQFGVLLDAREGQVRAIVCSVADTGRKLMQALRRREFGKRATNGLSARVGINTDVAEVALLPEALERGADCRRVHERQATPHALFGYSATRTSGSPGGPRSHSIDTGLGEAVALGRRQLLARAGAD